MSLLSAFSVASSLKLSQLIKERLPYIKIVWGGTNIQHEGFFAPIHAGLIDYFIKGDAERSLIELLKGNITYKGINNIKEFDEISKNIKYELEKTGYTVETKQISKGAYHCYIRFPLLLFEQGLSGFEEEKIPIQLDTEAQHFEFVPEQPILNKFDVFTRIYSTPLELMMAQKCYAILNKPRNKGRDFFDLVFLMGKNIFPNMEYLHQKIGIDNTDNLKMLLLKKCQDLNMDEMAKDVAPFLFSANDHKKVKLFSSYLENYSFQKN